MSEQTVTPATKPGKSKVKGRSPSDDRYKAKTAGKPSRRTGYKGPTKSTHVEPEDVITSADKIRSMSRKTANIIANYEGSHTERSFEHAKGEKPVVVRFPKTHLSKEEVMASKKKRNAQRNSRKAKRGEV